MKAGISIGTDRGGRLGLRPWRISRVGRGSGIGSGGSPVPVAGDGHGLEDREGAVAGLEVERGAGAAGDADEDFLGADVQWTMTPGPWPRRISVIVPGRMFSAESPSGRWRDRITSCAAMRTRTAVPGAAAIRGRKSGVRRRRARSARRRGGRRRGPSASRRPRARPRPRRRPAPPPPGRRPLTRPASSATTVVASRATSAEEWLT